jgi:hypothetical protein
MDRTKWDINQSMGILEIIIVFALRGVILPTDLHSYNSLLRGYTVTKCDDNSEKSVLEHAEVLSLLCLLSKSISI